MAELIYAYGLVRERFDASRVPAGLDDRAVTLQRCGELAALVSRLPAREYAPAEIERQSGEVSWLSPRAMAHDRVLTWAQEHGGVVPLPMFSLFGTEQALRQSLEDRAGELAAVFERVSGADEFGVRMYRQDDAMLASIDQLDASLAALRAEADAASPGQRYLLERKIAEQGKSAVRAASQRIAREVFDALGQLARDAVARSLTPEAASAPDTTLVLNGAFLVDRARVTEFRAAVGASVIAHEPRMRFDFTGPWPPYHFVTARAEADGKPAEGEGSEDGSRGRGGEGGSGGTGGTGGGGRRRT